MKTLILCKKNLVILKKCSYILSLTKNLKNIPNPNSPRATTFPTLEDAISWSCWRYSSGETPFVLSNSPHRVG